MQKIGIHGIGRLSKGSLMKEQRCFALRYGIPVGATVQALGSVLSLSTGTFHTSACAHKTSRKALARSKGHALHTDKSEHVHHSRKIFSRKPIVQVSRPEKAIAVQNQSIESESARGRPHGPHNLEG